MWPSNAGLWIILIRIPAAEWPNGYSQSYIVAPTICIMLGIYPWAGINIS